MSSIKFLTAKVRRAIGSGVAASPAAEPDLRRALQAVPVIMPHIEAQASPEGLIRIHRAVPAPHTWRERYAQRLGITRGTVIQLDRTGSWFWQQIDGRASLQALAGLLQTEFKMTAQEAEESTIAFAKLLLLRKLVGLRPARGGSGNARPNASAAGL